MDGRNLINLIVAGVIRLPELLAPHQAMGPGGEVVFVIIWAAHVDIIKHVDVPEPPRRRNSLHLPRDPEPRRRHDDVAMEHRHHSRRHHRHGHHDELKEPRHDHHVPVRPPMPFVPDPPQCALRCGNARIKGSRFCLNDTCRDASCNRPSGTWAGYCDEHGCGVEKCRRRRLVTKISSAEKHGAENFMVSSYCGVHSCRSWGCGGVGHADFDGFCKKHYTLRR
ncbi:hypothetical protein VUR80DRAFT_3570 [Thermomyces stellatus]